ncbi:tryptophanase [Symbiobacterium terraclitae]|uniref:Tryptophanase n=1 Tax=Symbiobacterium terraclitae TaxID=557451 RepID=A0ABS4JPJ9_9FIRM|nr:tryptophanase [Symbiobacterium terraclitae]MBP2017435.1 tryptophanase [Symbiobacterium terraclitae]
MPKGEPFKIKMVEPIRLISREEREAALKAAHYNPFFLRSSDVYIDLLTDSGTGAMSQFQWSAMMLGDEAYAGASSYYKLKETVTDITGYEYVIPTHQGRGAEKSAFSQLITRKGMYVVSNMFFDTTRGHAQLAGARPVDLLMDYPTDEFHPFKGNMDTVKLEQFINEHGAENIACIIMTVTNNSAGGQPVSMANIRETYRIAKKYGLLVLFDVARYAENCHFIRMREEGYADKLPIDIAREMFSYGDGLMMSAKKDALVNIGGLLAFRDEELYNKVGGAVVPFEGFLTYGGLAGRDLEAMAVGLREALDPDYLAYRVGQVQYLGELLRSAGVPIQWPVGGHAVFIDAAKFLPHIPWDQFPGHALTAALYLEGGVRAVEVGSLMMGRDPETGENVRSPFEFTRLAIPRRVYTNQHMEDVAEAVINAYKRREEIRGVRFTKEPKVLRHFTAHFDLV